jgi:hypothetical protein
LSLSVALKAHQDNTANVVADFLITVFSYVKSKKYVVFTVC